MNLKTSVFIVVASLCWVRSQAQDLFVIIKKNNQQSIRYPENVTMDLFDNLGNKRRIKKNDAITVQGDYTLEIDVPWSEKNDIIESEGGPLEIFILPVDIRGKELEMFDRQKNDHQNNSNKSLAKPRLEKKELKKSNVHIDQLNLMLVFDNGVVFKYEDGIIKAWEDGVEIKVTNKYLVQTSDALLKVSFDPKNGETWWVWEF